MAALTLTCATGAAATATDGRSPHVDPVVEAAIAQVDQSLAQGQRLFGQGRYGEAVEVLRKALAVSERRLGEGPYTALVLVNLGLNSASAGQYDEAERAYARALAIHENFYGRDSAQSLTLLTNFGLLFANTERPAKALPYLEKAQAICERDLTRDDPVAVRVREGLARVYRSLGRDAQADTLMREAGAASTAGVAARS